MIRACVVALVLTTAPHSALAIVTSDEPGSHIVVPGQPAFDLNLDGVARINTNLLAGPLSSSTAALITDRHLLSAAHVFDFDLDGQADRIFFGLAITTSVIFELADGSYEASILPDKVQIMPDWFEPGMGHLSFEFMPLQPRYRCLSKNSC
jgi:hypothetical protein